MVSEQDKVNAVDRLLAFFAAMNAWEKEMISFLLLIKDGQRTEEQIRQFYKGQRDRLKAVFLEYCEAGEFAARPQDESLHHPAKEPAYDPILERITAVKTRGTIVVVETEESHYHTQRLKYELVKVNGKWMVRDNRKYKGQYSTQWKPWPL